MKKIKGVISCFLSATIILSSISVGLTALAQDENNKQETTQVSSVDEPSAVALEDLDENYQALANALKSDYVNDTSNYTLGDRSIIANDNDTNDILSAVNAFYAIVTNWGTYSRGTTHYEIATSVATTLKNNMGSDWTDAMDYTIKRILSGCGTASNGNKENKHNTVTVNATTIGSLANYASADELPDTVSTAIQTDYYVTRTATGIGKYAYTLNSVSKNDEYATDSDTPQAIKAYYKMFCQGVIDTEYKNLDEDTYNSLSQDGSSVVSAVENLPDEIKEKFFGDVTTTVASDYLTGLILYALSEFTETVEKINALVDSKTEKDFTDDELAELNELISHAEMLYNSYTDEQKNAVKDGYDIVTASKTLYTDAYNYNNYLKYETAVSNLEKYADENYVISKDELDTIKDLLNTANDIKSQFIGTVDTDDLDTVYNKAEEQYNKAVIKYQWEEYYNCIDALADQFDIDVVTSISTNNVEDNANGDILATAKLNARAVELLNAIDSSTYSSTTSACEKIKEDLKTVLGTKAYATKNVDTVVTMLSGGELSQSELSPTFIVTPDYLANYNSVDELPESINYDVTTIAYNHTYNNGYTLNSVETSTATYSDTVAYTVFNEYENVFKDVSNGDLSNLTVDELSQLAVNAQNAIDAVSVYDDETVNRLVSTSLAQANQIIEDCYLAIITAYCNLVQELCDEYANRELVYEDIEPFYEMCELIDSAYDAIPVDRIDNEAVSTARLVYLSMCNKMKTFEKEYYYNQFISISEKNLNSLYSEDDEGNVVTVAVTSSNITTVKQAVKKVQNAYNLLEDEYLNDEQVLFYMDIVARLQNAVTSFVSNPVFNKYNVEYPSDVTTEQVEDVIKRLDSFLSSDYIEEILGSSLEDYVSGTIDNLLTGESANALIKTVIMTVYPALQDGLASQKGVSQDALTEIRSGLLTGLYPDPEDFKDRSLIKNNYYEVGQVLAEAKQDWDQVDWSRVDWEVESVEDFCDALGAALSGAAILIRAILQNQTANITAMGFISSKICSGNAGYRNDILPILELLGCEDVVSPDVFESKSDYDLPDMFKAILVPLVNRVDEILSGDTLDYVLELLPNIGYMFTYNIIADGVKDLFIPLEQLGMSLKSIAGTDTIDSDFVMEKLSALLGKQNLNLPDIDWAALAGIGEWQTLSSVRAGGTRNYIKGDSADVLVYLTYYLSQVVSANQNEIASMVGDNDTIASVVTKVATKCSDDEKTLASALFTLLTPFVTSDSSFETLITATNIQYNNGYTSDDVENLVSALTNIVNTVLPLIVDGSLNGLIEDNLYQGSVLNTLFNAVYGTLDNDTVKSILPYINITYADGTVENIDLSNSAIAKNFKQYGFKTIASSVNNLEDDATISSLVISENDWNIENSSDFANAIGAILAPFNGVLSALLAGSDITVDVAGVMVLNGANGYNNAIIPLLNALGCDAMSSSEYNADVNKDNSNVIVNIINPILNMVSDVANDPVNSVINIMPTLALYIDNGGVQYSIEQLLSPFNNVISAVMKFVDSDDFYSWLTSDVLNQFAEISVDWDNLQNEIVPLLNENVLNSITINSKEYSFELQSIDWSKLAGCATQTANEYTANTADTTVVVLRYVWSVVGANKSVITDLIKDVAGDSTYDTISPYLEKILALSADEVIKTLVELLNATDSSKHTADWSFLYDGYKSTSVSYSNGYTASDISLLTSTITNIVNTVLSSVLDSSLTDLVSQNVYTNEMMTTIASSIYSLFDNSTVVTVLGVLGADVSKDTIVKNLKKSGYKSVANSIDKASSFSKVSTKTAWNFKVKDRKSFVNALTAVINPLNDVLAVLLNSGTISIADTISITGAYGYANAIKPMLDALGCTTVSTSKYASDAKKDSNNLIANIINPLLDLVDDVLADPVNGALNILPSVANFVDKGGVQYAVEELLYPVTAIANPLMFLFVDETNDSSLIEILFNAFVDDMDWNNLQNQIVPLLNKKVLKNIKIGSTTVSLKLPTIDWSKLAGCGTLSKNTIKTNKNNEVVVLLKYVWKTVKANQKAINSIIKSLVGESTFKTLSPYVKNVYPLSSDEVITVLTTIIKGLDSSSYTVDWSFLYDDYKSTSVTYPSGVTASDINEVIDILSTALSNLLTSVLDISLTSLASDAIYTDATVTKIATQVYSLFDNSTVVTVLNVLGSDVSKNNVAKSLKSDYPTVAKSLKKAKSFSSVDTSKWKWNVTDRTSFANALTTVLSPLNDILSVFLNSGTINIAGAVDFTGANGYANAIKPMLDALGCTTVSASKYASDAKKDSNNLLLNIINPLLNLVDDVLANPINGALNIMPSVANFIDKGGVQTAVEALIYPVTNLVNPLLVVVMGENTSIFDLVLQIAGVDAKWDNIQNEVVPILNDKLLKNLKIGSNTVSLTLPNIDWSKLAGCGKISNKSVKADTAKELMTILGYVFDTLKTNKSTILDLVGGKNSTLGKIVNNLINCGKDGLTKMVVNILLKLETVEDAQWVFKSIATVTTTYTENYNEEDYTTALGMTDELITSMLSDLAGISLSSLLTDNLYTNSLVNTVAKAIYQNLESLDIGIDINTVLSVLDIDISTKGVASQISDYKSASKTISQYKKWSDVNFDNVDWGVEKGSREDFVNALAAVLRPLSPLLQAVLSGDDLVVLGSIEIKGGNGYNTAIVPIAEALSIDTSNLKSVKEYNSQADSDLLVTNILNPLLDKVEELADAPVATLCDALPNLAYFIYNGGLKASVENLIKPVTNILNEIDPIYSVNIDLSSLDNLDIDSLVNKLLANVKVGGNPIGIQITDIDLKTLAGRGTLQNYTSVRIYGSSNMTCKRVEANDTAVFISVIRYLLQNIQVNLSEIENLLSSLNIDQSVMDMINQILTSLATENVDSVIEMLMELLFDFGDSADVIATTTDDTQSNQFDPFNLGNYYWVYWLIFAVVTLAIGYFLFLIFKRKKDDDEENDLGVIEIETPQSKGE